MKQFSTKTLSVAAVAILLGLGGVAMANDSGENHQDNTNATGYNPYMPEFSAGAPQGRLAFGQARIKHLITHRAEHQSVHRELKR